MKITIEIEYADIQKIKQFYDNHKDNKFVQVRYNRNVLRKELDFSWEFLWKSIIMCLLTTQQRSGPTSPVSKFINTKPFPLSLQFVDKQNSPRESIKNVLSNFKGIRFTNRLPDFIFNNYIILNESNWEIIVKMIEDLIKNSDASKERYYARLIDKELKGFGPKQSRNLIQTIGLSKYQIPIDSRIIKWLNDFGFPLKLSSTGLQDSEYYNFVLNIIIELCAKANIYPCMLDAVIFTSYDKEEWTEESIIY